MSKRNASILMVAWLALWAGCGIDPLLPTINAAVNLAQGFPADGLDGINCWDLNGDGFDDNEEDVNGDGEWNAFDCRGAQGPQGDQGVRGSDGEEGVRGEPGPMGSSGSQGEAGLDGRDRDNEEDVDGDDCDHHPGNSCEHHHHDDDSGDDG